MRRRLLLLSTLVASALALAVGIEAAFAGNAVPQQATLTVSFTGLGMGWVTSDPAGIRCGSVCSGQFAVGTTVKLYAIVADGSTFGGISEPCNPVWAAPPKMPRRWIYCTVTLSGDTSVAATFNVAPPSPPPPPPACIVPSVRDETLETAEVMLMQDHCKTGRIKRAYSNWIQKGRVLSENPSPNWQRLNGTVSLVVSKGRR